MATLALNYAPTPTPTTQQALGRHIGDRKLATDMSAEESESPSPAANAESASSSSPATNASERRVSRWKREYESHRRYSKSWEDRFNWVTQSIDGSESAYCRFCSCVLLPRVACLAKHENSVKHQRRAADIEGPGSSKAHFVAVAVSPPSPSVVDSIIEDEDVGPFRPESDFPAREPISDFSNLANLSAKDIMEVVSPKILDAYSIWDLFLEKARLRAEEDIPAMVTIMDELGRVHRELKQLIVSCMAPLTRGLTGRASDPTVDVDLGLAAALGIPAGRYKQRPLADIDYDCVLDLRQLFRDSRGVVNIKPEPDFVAKTEPEDNIEEEEEDLDQPAKTEPGPKKKAPKKRGRKRKNVSEDENEEDFPEVRPVDKIKDEEEHVDVEYHDDDENDEDYVPNPPPRKRPSLPRNTKTPGPAAAKTENGDAVSKMSYACKSCGKPFLKEGWCVLHERGCSQEGDGGGRKGLNPASGGNFFKRKDGRGGGFVCNIRGCQHKTISCPLCEERFALASSLQEHLSDRHERDHACGLCSKRFFTAANLDTHVARFHREDNNDGQEDNDGTAEGDKNNTVPCQKCGRFLQDHFVKQHEAKCSGLTVRRPEYRKVGGEYFCTVSGCDLGYGFASMYGLRMHFHSTHMSEDEHVFRCDYCELRFSFNATRNKHVKEVHMKLFCCQYCLKRFGTKDKLRNHLLVHTGEKPFACDLCDFRAAKRSNLTEHRRSRHNDPGSGRFSCGACGRLFSTLGRVRRHIAHVHEREHKVRAKAQQMTQQLTQQQLHVVHVAAAANINNVVAEQEVAVEFLNDL